MILYHSGKLNPAMDPQVESLVPEENIAADGTMMMLRGRPRLITYADILRGDLKEASLPAMKRNHKLLALDSGAFSVAQGTMEISLEQYAQFLDKWAYCFTFVSNLDVLLGEDSHLLSAENQMKLEQWGHKPVPIYHLDEPWDVLDIMAERYEYIGLGGMAITGASNSENKTWLDECFKLIDGRCHVHGMGLANETFIKRWPWYSADSTNWLAAARFGKWPPFLSGVYTFASRVAPWVEYLDAVAASCGEDYHFVEAGDGQDLLFGPTTIDRKRVHGSHNVGPVEIAWPSRLPLEWPKPRLNVLLVGEQPSASSDPDEPLSGGSGKRLAELMGMSFLEYLDRVPRANLLDFQSSGSDLFSGDEAKARAEELSARCARAGVPMVLMGRKVARSMGMEGDTPAWLSWGTLEGQAVAVSPHPSHHNLWWNDKANREAAEEFYLGVVDRCSLPAEPPQQEGAEHV